MKKFLIITGFAVLFAPVLGYANSIRVVPHNQLLNISGRYEDGTLQKDVEYTQSFSTTQKINEEYCKTLPLNVGKDDIRESDVRSCRDYRRAVAVNMGQLVGGIIDGKPVRGNFLDQLACALSGGTSNRCNGQIDPRLQTAN